MQKSKFKIYSFLIFCSLFTAICFLFFFKYEQEIYQPKNPSSIELVSFTVKKGEGVQEISAHLKEQNIIEHQSFFRIYVLVKGFSKNLKAGQYSLSPSMNIPQIAEKLITGEIIKKKITTIEGWDLKDISDYFKIKEIASEDALFNLIGFPLNIQKIQPKDFSQEFDFLIDKPKNLSLEGYLFPDTYEISSQDDLETIVKKMLDNFDKKLAPELKREITLQKKSIFEIVTIASLIEKEVKTFEDKKIVSGILWKRLKIGMPLQIDATIVYIMNKKNTKVSIEDTKIDSPYNTYKYQGLPLGPICNPGLESIKAAIYPKQNQYLYYLSTPEGKTIFSKTLKEHNIAKERYLK